MHYHAFRPVISSIILRLVFGTVFKATRAVGFGADSAQSVPPLDLPRVNSTTLAAPPELPAELPVNARVDFHGRRFGICQRQRNGRWRGGDSEVMMIHCRSRLLPAD